MSGPKKQKLRGKCYVDGVLYRPSLQEARAYYSRTDVLGELAGAMQHWHVRLEPGEKMRHSWFNVDETSEVYETLMRLLDRMEENESLVKFPYMRIDARRYNPVTSWEEEDLWGSDFMMEKDGATWQECWDAVMPVIRILEYFGLRFWLKYTGHHSLHVMIPAENFPEKWGGLRFVEYASSFGSRLRAFFDRRGFQSLDETGLQGGGGGGGTNMPYTLNEDTGLLNYPVLPAEIPGFEPVKARIDEAKVRSFWREFPDDKRACAMPLVEEVLKPFDEQAESYGEGDLHPPLMLSDLLKRMDSPDFRERKYAVVRLPWFKEEEATERAMEALQDKRVDVRKNAVKALAGIDDPKAEQALRNARETCTRKELDRIDGALKYRSDIHDLRDTQK